MKKGVIAHRIAGTFGALLLGCLVIISPGFGLRADEKPASNGTPLDATAAEIVKFYGPVARANARVRNHQVLDGTVLDGDLHSRNGLIIRVVYFKGRCVLLEYTRVAGPLTLADVNPLLASNAGNFSWQQGKDSSATARFYRRTDDKAIAHWSTENDGSLLISAEDGSNALGGLVQ